MVFWLGHCRPYWRSPCGRRKQNNHAGRATDAKSSTAEPLFALELDQLFRSDRKPTIGAIPNLEQSCRMISSGLGHRTMAAEDRAYLVR